MAFCIRGGQQSQAWRTVLQAIQTDTRQARLVALKRTTVSDTSRVPSCTASSFHVRWPKAAKQFRSTPSSALEPRQQIEELLAVIEAEEGKPLHVDGSATKVMDALLDELPAMRAVALVRAWVELGSMWHRVFADAVVSNRRGRYWPGGGRLVHRSGKRKNI